LFKGAKGNQYNLNDLRPFFEVALVFANEAGVEMPLVARLTELMHELTVEDLDDLR
jgi:hypothetical protein